MEVTFYLRSYNIEEARREPSKKKSELNGFADLSVHSVDGEIILKKDGKIIIRCKEYKVSGLFAHKNWEDVVHLSEYTIGDKVHLLISAFPGCML